MKLKIKNQKKYLNIYAEVTEKKNRKSLFIGLRKKYNLKGGATPKQTRKV